MKPLRKIPGLLLVATLPLWVWACATQSVNPPQARANTGYVDLHTDSTNELSWQVARFEDRTQTFKKVWARFDPPPLGILRLEFAPGHYRLQVTFMNRPVLKPAEVEVEVQDGKITPIQFKLTAAGTAVIRTKEVSSGATLYGRYGRSTKIGTDETATYDLSAEPEPPVAYAPRERMPYAH